MQKEEISPLLSNANPTHMQYCLLDGSIAPSVTMALNVLDKGKGMKYWAWDLGKQGLDYRDVRDVAARIDTLAHHLIACHLKNMIPITDLPNGYSQDEVVLANKRLAKFRVWESHTGICPVMIEVPLVSEVYKYGGTPGIMAEIKDEFELWDIKTGGGIYESYFYELAAHRKLLEEQGWPIARAGLLILPPDDGPYEVAMQLDYDRDLRIFLHSLAILRLQEWKAASAQLIN